MFILHITWFVIFLFTKFPVTDFVVTNLKLKLGLVALGILIAGLLYYFWLRHIQLVHKAGVVARETFFILYIGFVFYLLLGILLNPLFTFTQLGSVFGGYGLHRDYVSYDQMSPNIKLAVIASEDQLFPDHDGFDIKAIKMAIKYNKKRPDRVRGGSTISQQVAKNYFLYQGGGFFRKGMEVFCTFNIEELWSKRTILERYLNIAEMGPGIFGVQAASKKYFNKNASELTRAEAAQIAACLPNPKLYTVKPLSPHVQGRYDDIMRQMNNLESDPDIQELIK